MAGENRVQTDRGRSQEISKTATIIWARKAVTDTEMLVLRFGICLKGKAGGI